MCHYWLGAEIARGRTEHGVQVSSAGIKATEGNVAAANAMLVLREQGVPLTEASAHASSKLTPERVERASHIICLTAAHKAAVLAQHPTSLHKVCTLLSFTDSEKDVEDPFGMSEARYRECFDEMKPALLAIKDTLLQ